MARIYTRGGDKGMTSLHGGDRVPKDDIRIEANGTLDEANAEIGFVRALLSAEDEWQPLLREVQLNLMVVMSHVATPSAKRTQNPNHIPEDLVTACEQQIDCLAERIGENNWFILPGGTELAARLQIVRTIIRRAERHLWTLHRTDPLPISIMQYVNRLSDLFFLMARYDLLRQGTPEERWQSFLYKKRKE